MAKNGRRRVSRSGRTRSSSWKTEKESTPSKSQTPNRTRRSSKNRPLSRWRSPTYQILRDVLAESRKDAAGTGVTSPAPKNSPAIGNISNHWPQTRAAGVFVAATRAPRRLAKRPSASASGLGWDGWAVSCYADGSARLRRRLYRSGAGSPGNWAAGGLRAGCGDFCEHGDYDTGLSAPAVAPVSGSVGLPDAVIAANPAPVAARPNVPGGIRRSSAVRSSDKDGVLTIARNPWSRLQHGRDADDVQRGRYEPRSMELRASAQ